MYGIMIAIGLLCAFVCLFLYSKKKGIPEKFVDFVFYDAIASIVIGFGAATVIQSFYNFLANPAGGFHINLGQGMTFMGGLLGGVICFFVIYFIFRPFMRGRVYKIFSIAPCCILVGHAFGRIGCFFAGCCYGVPTDSFLGVTFPGHSQAVHPTMLYEAAFLFVLFGVFTFLLFKFDFKHNMSLYLVSYGIFRFLLEFIRGDHRGELLGFISPSQTWSALMVVLGVALYFLTDRFYKKKAAKKTDE
jgi:phosphatidylglycerol:prolipoprotein diacylglycerol transferase